MLDYNRIPIRCPEDDKLGISRTVQAVVDHIRASDQSSGSIVAIRGTRGSGKSSLLNLAFYHLRCRKYTHGPKIVRLHLKHYRTEAAMAVAICRELKKCLVTAIEGKENALAQLCACVARSEVTPTAFNGDLGAIGDEILADDPTSQLGGSDDIELLQEEVAEALRNQNHQTIFVIDDLDRFSRPGLLAFFRLISSIGRLPKVTYLLAYDSTAVEITINRRYEQEGSSFLGKYVHMWFDVPKAPTHFRREKAIAGLKHVFGVLGEDKHRRVEAMLDRLVLPELRTLGEVDRFVSAFSIAWKAKKTALDPADFLAVETIRQFDPVVYQFVWEQKWRITGMRKGIGVRLDLPATMEGVVPQATEATRERVESALTKLFPKLHQGKSVDEHVEHEHGDSERQVDECRVHSLKHFDKYFQYLMPQPADIAKRAKRVISKAGDARVIKKILRECRFNIAVDGGSELPYLLDELAFNCDDMRDEAVAKFVRTIFQLAGEFCSREDNFTGRPLEPINWYRLLWLIKCLLLRRMEIDERSELLLEASDETPLGWLVYFTKSLLADHGEDSWQGSSRREQALVTKDGVETLKARALQRINAAVKDMSLIDESELHHILVGWRRFIPRDEGIRSWLIQTVEERSGWMKLMEACFGDAVGWEYEDGQIVVRGWNPRAINVDMPDGRSWLEWLKQRMLWIGEGNRASDEERALARRYHKAIGAVGF